MLPTRKTVDDRSLSTRKRYAWTSLAHRPHRIPAVHRRHHRPAGRPSSQTSPDTGRPFGPDSCEEPGHVAWPRGPPSTRDGGSSSRSPTRRSTLPPSAATSTHTNKTFFFFIPTLPLKRKKIRCFVYSLQDKKESLRFTLLS